MIVMDWSVVAFGFVIGAGASAAFFAGLEFGMRLALRKERPVNILALSAFLRIAALLGIGGAVATFLGLFGLAGFALAFFIARITATAIARSGIPVRGTP
ncbi:MAG: ATP synthase subunit AtpR [Pseudomonadota bacterium]